MRPVDILFHAIKQAILFLFVFLPTPLLVFFIIGFIYYTPPEIKPPYNSITIHIKRIPAKVCSHIEDKEKKDKERESKQYVSATEPLPFLNKRPGKVRVATQYKSLLAQMDLILEDIGSVRVSNAVEDRWETLARIEGNDSPCGGMSEGSTLETIIRKRMVMIQDMLEYASSQAGIPMDLLAAVAWAESKMLPYAVNVRGKAYYFTSREQALKMLRGIETDDMDIGLFQVNYRLWGKPLGLSKEDLLHSRTCAIIGAMILKYNLQRHKDPWVAIGRYHSGNIRRIKGYQKKVSWGLMIIRTLSINSHKSEAPEAL
jgi:hypothetical protein